ncbi:MAG: DUF4230 domain-containing protein [Byssovorax sp.]
MSLEGRNDPSTSSPLLRKVVAVVGASWLIFLGGVLGLSAVLAIAFHLALSAYSALPSATTTHTEIRPTPDVLLAIKSLARLETQSYHLERVVDLSDHESHVFGLLQTKDAILLVAVGDVVAGVDLERVSADDVTTDWTARKAILHLPPPSVFSATLDEKATRVYSRSTDLLAARHEDLEDRARAEAVRSMEKAAVDQGILDHARVDAEKSLTGLLRSLGFSDVQIDWKK